MTAPDRPLSARWARGEITAAEWEQMASDPAPCAPWGEPDRSEPVSWWRALLDVPVHAMVATLAFVKAGEDAAAALWGDGEGEL